MGSKRADKIAEKVSSVITVLVMSCSERRRWIKNKTKNIENNMVDL
jgi:hypothetical protein